jgi:hypothetical protein
LSAKFDSLPTGSGAPERMSIASRVDGAAVALELAGSDREIVIARPLASWNR